MHNFRIAWLYCDVRVKECASHNQSATSLHFAPRLSLHNELCAQADGRSAANGQRWLGQLINEVSCAQMGVTEQHEIIFVPANERDFGDAQAKLEEPAYGLVT